MVVCKSQDKIVVPKFKVPTNAHIHAFRHFWKINAPFCNSKPPAELEIHPKWAHMDPMALAMCAAWGGWCKRKGLTIEPFSASGPHINYAARMKLFEHLGIRHEIELEEHEESGRFLPIARVSTQADLDVVMGNVSALLHLDRERDALAAVQYCVSELIRNVLEHSASPEGAYVCAQRYLNGTPPRVSIAVADCGIGIAKHLSGKYSGIMSDEILALRLAMQPGVSGAHPPGIDGISVDNAGAGLFITRAIAKATGGYFVLQSGKAAFRLRRNQNKENFEIAIDAFEDKHTDVVTLPSWWEGTVAAVEVVTEEIPNFSDFFRWIVKQLPAKKTAAGRIKFT